VTALKSSGIAVEIHDDHFAKDAQDVDWLPEVGKQGWVILTKDARIGKNHLERMAVTNAGISMFTLASQNLSGKEMADIFLKSITKMQEFVRQHPAPFIAKVYRFGSC
jgi:predicted nuclease of predicted toxin-antitoxin system